MNGDQGADIPTGKDLPPSNKEVVSKIEAAGVSPAAALRILLRHATDTASIAHDHVVNPGKSHPNVVASDQEHAAVYGLNTANLTPAKAALLELAPHFPDTGIRAEDVIPQIKGTGIDLATALRSLVAEARLTALVRYTDTLQPPQSDAAKNAAIRQAARFGLPDDQIGLKTAKNALSDLEQLLQKRA